MSQLKKKYQFLVHAAYDVEMKIPSIDQVISAQGEENIYSLQPVGIRYDGGELFPDEMHFFYDREYTPHFRLRKANVPLFAFQDLDRVNFIDNEVSGDFLLSRTTHKSSGFVMELVPRIEPLLIGSDVSGSCVRAIVINGPNTFFSQRPFKWSFEGLVVEYHLLDGVQKILDSPVESKSNFLSTGVLTIRTSDGVEKPSGEWFQEIYEASRVLTWLSGVRVGIGHVEILSKDATLGTFVGFSKTDSLAKVANWFDIEVFEDAQDFASKFALARKAESSEHPIMHATEFYRISNAIRKNSIEMAIIASYSALEIMIYDLLRSDAGWSRHLLSNRNPMPDKIQAACQFVRLQCDPLQYASRINEDPPVKGANAFSLIAACRNSIVHAERSLDFNGLQLHEMWLMSQWLVEILVFYRIGYRGKMADRRIYTGWRGANITQVPLPPVV